MTDVRCIVAAEDLLGEGPVWSPEDGRLYWFDILGRRLSWHRPETGDGGAFTLPVRASAAAPCVGGGLLVASERGLARVDTTSGAFDIVSPITLEPGFRTNDGKIDVAGRFWWSTMDDDDGRRPGAVYRTDPDGSTHLVLEGIHIPNTLSCSPDGRTLYLADSAKGTIRAYPIDAEGGLGAPAAFVDTGGADGTPDGSAVDAEGYIWNAQWGGGRIVRYAPDGRTDRVVAVPADQPTSCAFGGPDLATLYVTSARVGLSTAALARQPLAGALFAFEPGPRGLPLPEFSYAAFPGVAHP